MNISISNIAWKKEENFQALAVLKEQNVHAIDLAPTLLFNSISDVTKDQIVSERSKYDAQKISIVAMQSLLYGAQEVSLFDGEQASTGLMQHLEKVFFIGEHLKVKNVVFGSPKNRFIRDETIDHEKIAIVFFTKVSDLARKHNLTVCMEANPKEYECNFLTNTFDAVDFIKKINHPNFKLNFDTSTVLLNGNDFKEVLDYAYPYMSHVHISSPHIQQIDGIDHKKISDLLKEYQYKGYVALEVKPNLADNNINSLKKNLSIFRNFYG
jgi:hypothetical protein|tara:strand:+ start:228 stop:1031 length:804 start_codon:yes stop_codon:yes gene_type:complete